MPVPKGTRYGGKPKGYKAPKTLQTAIDKEVQRERARQMFVERLEPLVHAQLQTAEGIGYMLIRRPDGTYSRATDVKQIDAALAVGGSAFKMFTQAPNTQAFMALWDRTLDKPIERQEVSGKDGGPLEIVVKKPW